ncbi:Cyclic nucleotide-gated potassium channel [Thalassocella blandensis]|nr:Cyclic nucleotide-gated potassium channel [Thalassocella blandensis]
MKSFEALANSYGKLIEDAFATADTFVPLKYLRPSFLEDLFHHVAIQTIFANQVIFEDGTIDKQLIYLQSGEIELHYGNGHTEKIDAYQNTMPIANQQPRPCRCVALTDCTLVRIDSDRADRTLSWSQIADYLIAELSLNRDYDEDIDWMQTVLNSNLFLKAPPVNAHQIFSRMTPMVVEKGEVVLRQGDIGDCCYFIKEGEATVSATSSSLEPECELARIGPGRCFGEDALVNETVRNATVTMQTPGVLMRLEKSDFQLLLQNPAIDEVDLSEIREMLEVPIWVDVRTDDEYNEGHLPESANIPLSLLSLKKRVLAPEQLYVMYCDTGRRSAAAAYLLGKEGYNVISLKDGLVGEQLMDKLVKDDGYILRDGVLLSGQ